MKIGACRSRRFHRIGKPEVEWELSGFREGAKENQDEDGRVIRMAAKGLRPAEKVSDLPGAGRLPDPDANGIAYLRLPVNQIGAAK